jgi:hypothetical protein
LPGQLGETTVSEIVAATCDGLTPVYTDSPMEQIGFIDLTHPDYPVPTGTLGVDLEPTSVVVDLPGRAIVRQIELGGQRIR